MKVEKSLFFTMVFGRQTGPAEFEASILLSDAALLTLLSSEFNGGNLTHTRAD